jgi:hypothetical protein
MVCFHRVRILMRRELAHAHSIRRHIRLQLPLLSNIDGHARRALRFGVHRMEPFPVLFQILSFRDSFDGGTPAITGHEEKFMSSE